MSKLFSTIFGAVVKATTAPKPAAAKPVPAPVAPKAPTPAPPPPPAPVPPAKPAVELLDIMTLLETAGHEGLVLEAYLDSKKIWTWSIGVTNASGHQVYPRYKDKPQTMEQALTVYEWLMRTKYAPDVHAAFKGHKLTLAQFTAALSFHYNTGAIKTAEWVKAFKRGDLKLAEDQIMNWSSPPEIKGRRRAERDLFFKGVWSNKKGEVTVYPVRKPSYTPDWKNGKVIDLRGPLAAILAKAA